MVNSENEGPRIAVFKAMNRSPSLSYAVFSFFLAALPLAAATRPTGEQEAIDWLLSEVRRSDSVFIRNGAEYDGEKAAAHLKSKLFWAGKRVQTAHDFIVGVATHSEASGKPYEIRAKDGKPEPLQKWLFERLDVFEKAARAKAENSRTR
jgi:hypothetical protein